MTPVRAVFFDLFGTLLALDPLADVCERLMPGRGDDLATRLRTHQLQASWLLTAMDRWMDFDQVTIAALRTTLEELGVASGPDVRDVADAFADLPLVEAAVGAVTRLRADGTVVGVLTNASARTLERVASRLPFPLDHRLSADEVRRFKPHPSVYRLATDATGSPPAAIGFVTANGWDAAGAGLFGFQVAWLRSGAGAALPAVGGPIPLVTTWADVPTIFDTRA